VASSEKAKVWLLIEEIESGSYGGGGTYIALSAHRTEAGAPRLVACDKHKRALLGREED